MKLTDSYRWLLVSILSWIASVAWAEMYRPYGENIFEVEGVSQECRDGYMSMPDDKYFAVIAQEDILLCMLKPEFESGIMTEVISFEKGKGYYALWSNDEGDLTSGMLYSPEFPDMTLDFEYIDNWKEWHVNFTHFINFNGDYRIECVTHVHLTPEIGSDFADFIFSQIKEFGLTFNPTFLQKYMAPHF